MYIGIDIGTSSVKAIVLNEAGNVVDETSVDLSISRPGPLMSEQNPRAWWLATDTAMRSLSEYASDVKAIGLSGQMHGAVLLNSKDEPLRAAILWNDGRSGEECQELEKSTDVRTITGNAAMPGFTAPKLLWVDKHEPLIFRETKKVLLPKDYVRLKMTGEYATDMSDAAGTLWLDTAQRTWSDAMLESTALSPDHMPTLFEGNQVTGELLPSVASRWGMSNVAVVGGAGDQAAGAIGAGSYQRGYATLSLGTSGVIFAPDNEYRPNPAEGVHTFCHALPNTWHQMAVILSAAGSLAWITNELGFQSESHLMTELEQNVPTTEVPIFLPYLSGERTPHNNPRAKGVFIGLTLGSNKYTIAWSVLEGVAFALRDCKDALLNAQADLFSMSVIGGGTRSDLWGQLIADVLNQELVYRHDAAVGPALGAARLAMLGISTHPIDEVCQSAIVRRIIEPNPQNQERVDSRYALFRAAYRQLEPMFEDLN